MSESTIAIIGAGASGIGTAKAFREAGLNFEIIEKTSRFGGNWQPDGAASKMYRSAHLISSKRNSQFSDFPMPESYPHYPHHSLMYQYLESIADHFELAASTRFETEVEQTHQNRNGDWELAFTDGSSKTYQGLVVCNGLLRRPITPAMAKDFSERSLHAADYRTNTDFEGQTVLVVGGGNSGCDIAVDVAQTAGKVLHSTRRGYHYMPKFISGKPTQEWLMEQSQYFSTPEEYWEHVCKTFKLAGFDGVDFGLETPDHHISEAHPIMNSNILYAIGHGDIDPKENLERIDGSVCHFAGGEVCEVDAIIWCTGYDIELPFMSSVFGDIKSEIQKSFLRMVSQEKDNLLFLGYLNTPSGIGNVANIMGRFAAAYFVGREQRSEPWLRLQAMIKSGQRVDLGEARFMDTDRHAFEVDLWKFIKAVNFMTSKLKSAVQPPPMAHQIGNDRYSGMAAQ